MIGRGEGEVGGRREGGGGREEEEGEEEEERRRCDSINRRDYNTGASMLWD